MDSEIAIVLISLFMCSLAFVSGYLTGHTVGMIDGRRESEHGKILSKTDKDGKA